MKLGLFIFILIIIWHLLSTPLFPFSNLLRPPDKNFSFKPEIHKKINSKMLDKALHKLKISFDKEKTPLCKTRLIRSQTLQDFFLPFYSKGHFDNCAFGKSINYINRLQAQNEDFAREYEEENEPDDKNERKLLKRKILFNTGKILHAVQDFYSHSNYLELMEGQHQDLSAVPVLRFWEQSDQNKILQMNSGKGLITGTAWWVFPKQCQKGSPSHKKLAKDSEKFKTGRELTIWTNPVAGKKFTKYQAAVFLAEESSYQFLLHTFNKYPILKEHCGNFQQPVSGKKLS